MAKWKAREATDGETARLPRSWRRPASTCVRDRTAEAANEELQSSNEEVQSANEELRASTRSGNLEGRDPSSNEAGHLNEELQNRNSELGQSNNEFVNLLASVQLPIVSSGRIPDPALHPDGRGNCSN